MVWSTDDPDIAEVSSSGVVTAKHVGTVNITASCGSESGTCTIKVTQPVTTVILSSNSESLIIGDTVDLSATVEPAEASHPTVTWKSSDESIATVDSTGAVTAKSFGSAAITAEADGQFGICIINVIKTDVTNVRLSSTSETMGKSDTLTLSATVSPSSATYPNVTWKSSDTSVAKVNQSGQVTAVSDGAAAIIADADGVYAVCTVLVSSEQGTDDGNDNGDNGNDADNDDNAQASPTPTATAMPSGESGGNGEPSETNEPKPTPKTVIITIVVSELPEGATAVKLPDGTVIELDGSDTMDIEVGAEQLSDDGTLELVALDDEGTPLGVYDVDGQSIAAPDTGSAGGGIWPVLMWVLIGIGVLGAAGATLYLIMKKRNRA